MPDDEETGFETTPERRWDSDDRGVEVGQSSDADWIRTDASVRRSLGRPRIMLLVGAVALLVLLVLVVYFLMT